MSKDKLKALSKKTEITQTDFYFLLKNVKKVVKVSP
jgi:hypothetical protein